jgi:GNAT superfamily N-acetyltransferase
VTTVLRRATAADVSTLTRIAHAAKRHWGYPEQLIELWKDDLTVLPADVDADLVFCAEREGAMAGFYSVSGIGTAACEIEHMWVLPEHIGTGLGRALFEHMVRTLREQGVRTLRIASDPNAVGFYERMGARREGDVPATPEGRTLPLLVLTIAG